jgi:hypothetical protein
VSQHVCPVHQSVVLFSDTTSVTPSLGSFWSAAAKTIQKNSRFLQFKSRGKPRMCMLCGKYYYKHECVLVQ